MGRLALEVADIFRSHGPVWRDAQHNHLSLGQLKVMSAIEQCRTATLGAHVLCCPACAHQDIAYNSCRNRHCPNQLAPYVTDWQTWPTHTTYLAVLQELHKRKSAFWSKY